MKRIRNLGLAAVAALALTAAVGASSAGAAGTGFTTDEYRSYLAATATGSGIELGVSGLPAVVCPGGTSYTDWLAEQTATLFVPPSTAEYKCKTGSGSMGSPTLKPNGCDFTLSPAGEGSLGIGPAGCGPMVLHISNWGCNWLIGPQTVPLYGSFATEGSPSKVKATAHAPLHYESLENTGLCGSGGTINLQATWLLEAFGESESSIGLHLADKNGFFLSSGLFQSEAYPLAPSGGQDPANVHKLRLGTESTLPIECKGVKFTTSPKLSKATSLLQVAAAYEGCVKTVAFIKRPVTVDMNSCYYQLSASGTSGVACAVKGDAIEVVTDINGKGYICKHMVAPQEGLEKVTYSAVGAGADRGVAVSLNLKSIKSTETTGGALCGPKEGTTGTYVGGTTLAGQ